MPSPEHTLPEDTEPEADREHFAAAVAEAEDELSPEEKEIREFPGVDRIVVKGSTALALKMGQDLSIARDLDVFFVTSPTEDDEATLQTFHNLAEAKKKLPPAEYRLVAQFAEQHDLSDRPIHLTRASEYFLKETQLFCNEPEVILWDEILEEGSRFYQPITAEEKKRLAKKLELMMESDRFESDRIYEMERALETAHDIHLYRRGRLIDGEVPDFLEPAHNSLVATLRLIDLGRRFHIDFDSTLLRTAEDLAGLGDLEIIIPPESPGPGQPERLTAPSAEHVADEEDFDSDDEGAANEYFATPRPLQARRRLGLYLDAATISTAMNKELMPMLTEDSPHLAELVTKIQAAGGIRPFVAKEYGPGYLAWDTVRVGDYRFSDELSPVEQTTTLKIWKEAQDRFRTLFRRRFDVFVERFLTIRSPELTKLPESAVREAVIRAQLAEKLESKNVEERRKGYYTLYNLARESLNQGAAGAVEYQAFKALLQESFTKEQNRQPRKDIVESFVQLARTGLDTVIASDFADLVRRESAAIKTRKAAKREILSPEGMLILRGLFYLHHEDATRAIWELTVNPAVDPRLRKLCLQNLAWRDEFGTHSGLAGIVDQDRQTPARLVPWEDYAALLRIKKISSSTVRERLQMWAYDGFVDIRNREESVASRNAELGPDLPPEFFLPLMTALEGNENRIAAWNRFLRGVKSSKARESMLYNLASVLSTDSRMLGLLTDKLIDTPDVTKERIALADRLFKKIHALVFFQTQIRGSRGDACGNPHCSSCRNRRSEAARPIDVQSMLKEMKAPSLLEVQLDQQIVSQLYEVTGRQDLTSDRLQTLFNAWEDPEPVFMFTSQLARYRSTEDGKRTLDLMGAMLAHMDPPNLEEWKQWRYSTDDPEAAEQLAGLQPEQIAAYAEDDFTDLGEVLVGLLPSDKPERIQREILHSLQHDWASGRNPLARALETTTAARQAEPPDLAATANRDLPQIEHRLQLIDQRLSLRDSLRLLERLPDQLAGWRKAEDDKRAALRKMGYRGDERRDEIEQRIRDLKDRDPGSKAINALATLKPGELSDKVRALLERFDLTEASSAAAVAGHRQRIEQSLVKLEQSEDYRRLQQELFPDSREVADGQWREALKDLKAAQILLKLTNLTPQLIAFNKIAADKKKATLSASLEYLRRNYAQETALQGLLDRVETIIAEGGKPVGKDRLAVVFTDSPMAMLTIGKFPHGAASCQNYENGDSVLAAYMADAYTKMCLLVDLNKLPPEVNAELEQAADRDEKMKVFNTYTLAFLNAAVGRRLTKIVRDAAGQSRVFLEPVYTPLDRESTTKTMNAYAVTHLGPRLQLPLVRGGGDDTVLVAASRNFFQYEDGEHGGPGGAGAGLGTKEGPYTMSAQPLQPDDYAVPEAAVRGKTTNREP